MLWKQGLLCVLMLAAGALRAEEPGFTSERIFPLNPQHNHAPGVVELPDGQLFVSWYRGSGERKADDVAVYGARLQPGEKSWSEPFLLVDTPGFPDCNTSLHLDDNGRLWLFWPIILANTWESCLTRVLVTDNPGTAGCPKWTRSDTLFLKPADFAPEAKQRLAEELSQLARPLTGRETEVIATLKARLDDKLLQRLGWQPRCKPTVLPSGRMLLPLYSDTYSFSLMAISDDHGQTWRASQPLMGFGNIQPSVLRRNDGTLIAYMRENGITEKVRVCESTDDGETWGRVTTLDIPNPGSGLDAVRLRNGVWLLVLNDTVNGRNRLSVVLSDDEGKTWPVRRSLEDHPEGKFHYPAMIQGRDGRIHVVYSEFVEGGKTMKHAAFHEAWVRERQ